MEFACGNIFIRAGMLQKQGQFMEGHQHHFDHVTYCTSGRLKIVRTSPDGRTDTRELSPGELPVLIKAEYTHHIEALEDYSGYHCIYAHRTPQGEVTQQFTGWMDAYT